MKRFHIISAINLDGLIGIKEYGTHNLPWPLLRLDMRFFHKKTTTVQADTEINAIIVGNTTWVTLPPTYQTHLSRYHIIITRQTNKPSTDSLCYVNSFTQALDRAHNLPHCHEIYVIGGGMIYDYALQHPLLDKIYLTVVYQHYPTQNLIEETVSFPLNIEEIQEMIQTQDLILVEKSEKKVETRCAVSFDFRTYQTTDNTATVYLSRYHKAKFTLTHAEYLSTKYHRPHNDLTYQKCIDMIKTSQNVEEYQYINLIKRIMEEGKWRSGRNGRTKYITGCQLTYDLGRAYPLCTIKRSYPKGIFAELMWILSGSTNVTDLQKVGVHVWDKNATAEYLASVGLPYEPNDIGPSYGFQLRHYGATYVDCRTNYQGQGIDQLQRCVDQLINNPTDRRIIIDLWNCACTDKMALPACCFTYHFTVDLYEEKREKRGRLNCHAVQRSWDVLLGWNTSTAALLTYLLAHHCQLDPGTLVHSVTDAHIYEDHIKSGDVDVLMGRTPRCSPTLKIISLKTNITEYTYDDLILEHYYPCPPMKFNLVA